jgi:hypothetical protein
LHFSAFENRPYRTQSLSNIGSPSFVKLAFYFTFPFPQGPCIFKYTGTESSPVVP